MNRAIRNGFPNLFGAASRERRVAVTQDNDEFFSAITAHKVISADSANKPICHFDEDLITDGVTHCVVNALEVIYIGENYR